MKSSPKTLWTLVDELRRAREQGLVPLIEAVEQVYQPEEAVDLMVTSELSADFDPKQRTTSVVGEREFLSVVAVSRSAGARPKILIADDHAILLEALKKLIELSCTVVGTATDGRTLVTLAEKLLPDVIIADINMPNLNGWEACERLVKKLPGIKVIFLTVNEDRESAEEAIRRGASGYVLKKSASIELFKAIQTVMSGRSYITPQISREPLNIFISRAKSHGAHEPLTARQREVLQLLAEGKSMKEAADILSITARTVAFHKYSMMEHLGITRNSELVRYATQAGLVDPTLERDAI